LGRYILKDAPGARKSNELVEYLIPDDLRPRGVMKVEGYIKDPQNAVVPAYIAVTDLPTQKRVYSGRPQADGTYFFYLMEGSRYEMSVDPEKSNTSFFAREFDLTTEKIPQKERVNVILRQPVPEDELPLALVAFKPNTTTLEPSSDSELKRLLRVSKANPQLLFEIQITMTGYREDSVMSDVGLTEVRVDSIVQQLAKIDSAGQMSKRDTLFIRKTYHNDRTAAQAQSVLDYIVKLGGDPNSFSFKTIAMPAALPEETKLVVKAVAKQR
jgi:outer membrane protein OmpA-like peptidoglycan-associated protein